MDPGDLIGRVLVPAAVIATFGLIRKYMPARKLRSQRSLLHEDFTSTNRVVYVSMILIGVAFAFFSHEALVTANRAFAERDGPAAFCLLPSPAIWWFFPGLGALALSWEITIRFWSLFADSGRIADFLNWTHGRAGFDATRFLRWLALLVVMPIGIATALAIPIHSSLRETDIVVGHYAQLKPQYLPYSQAQRIILVDGFRGRNGGFTARAEVLIDFDSGVRWSSAANRDFRTQVEPGLVEFVSQKARLPVEHAGTEAELHTQGR